MSTNSNCLLIEQTSSHSPNFIIKPKSIELSQVFSPFNRKQIFPTVQPLSSRVHSKIREDHSKKRKGKTSSIHKTSSLPKITFLKKISSSQLYDNHLSSNNIFSTMSFDKANSVLEPSKFHMKIVKEANNKFEEKLKRIKKEIYIHNIEEKEKMLNDNSTKEEEKEIEKARFIKSYNKKHLNQEIINIISKEANHSKTKKILDEYNRIYKATHKEKPLYMKKLDPIMFISKKHPMLEINQVGTMQKMFIDGQLMGQLMQDSFEHVAEKKYKVVL